MRYIDEKKTIIYWAKKLNERGLVTARSGNISLKTDKGILITSHDCYLGEITNDDILFVDAQGKILEGIKEITSEKDLHLNIHDKFPEERVVLHSHSPYTVAFFHYFKKLDFFSFEAKFYLGDIKVIPQSSPTVTDTEPVISALDNNNIVVIGDHGVVAMGEDFKEAFSLIELLEEQAKVNFLVRSTRLPVHQSARPSTVAEVNEPAVAQYKLLSKEHVERLVKLVNNDREAQELGKKYDLTCTLAVKNQDTTDTVRFYYDKGKIVKYDFDDNAEFIIIGKESILKKVFNCEIDPFVASTQGKVKTKGDFSKMSRWYPVLVRTFKLWVQAPVE